MRSQARRSSQIIPSFELGVDGGADEILSGLAPGERLTDDLDPAFGQGQHDARPVKLRPSPPYLFGFIALLSGPHIFIYPY